MISLRPYQQEMINSTRNAFNQGAKRVLLVGPTGCGKGTIASEVIHSAVQKQSSIIFAVGRRELVKDMSKRLKRLSIPHGIMMGAQTRGSHLPVQVASVDTLRNRMKHFKSPPDIVFVDEAHLWVSDKSKEIIDQLSGSGTRIILMTATPIRLDGRGLKEIADVMVEGPSVAELIDQGYLVPPTIYAPSAPDLSGVRTTAGDYNQEQLAAVMGDKRLVGDIVAHWKELAFGRKSVAFCVNRKHSEEVRDSFLAAGIRAVSVDANTPDGIRDETWRELASGDIQVVCSVGIISYGWDVPEVDCVILARPTESLALHLQQCGRGLRSSPGKRDCLILDHAGNMLRHGLPDDPRKWSLDARKARRGKTEDAEVAPLPQVCPKCAKVVKNGTPVCQCGYVFLTAHPRAQVTPDVDETGKLTLLQSRVYIYPQTTGDIGKDSLIGQASARGYNPGWVHHRTKALDDARAKYRAAFGSEPKAHWTGGMIASMIKQAEKEPQFKLC